jgi:hypothetical protein
MSAPTNPAASTDLTGCAVTVPQHELRAAFAPLP